jgi:hypothetical protein
MRKQVIRLWEAAVHFTSESVSSESESEYSQHFFVFGLGTHKVCKLH